MSDTLEYFFDIGSPYSYLASTQIDDLVERTGVDVSWRPFLLGGVFKMTDNEMPAAVRPKATYMMKDLHRWADHYDVPFQMNSAFPVNTLYVQRALLAADEHSPGSLQPFARAAYEAVWTDDRDLSDKSEIALVADSVGLDGEAIVASASEDHIKQELKSITSEAVDRGAFGAPTFFVGEQMFWGNDRLQFVEQALT
jgi:2-hydroxychromene-2-carboxylate isomerase